MNKIKSMRIGYARVSTTDRQTLGLELQIRSLEENGCDRIFSEEVSGSKDNREQMLLAIDLAKKCKDEGYEVIFYIYKLDRLGRHTSKAIQIIEDLTNYGIQVISIKEQFDTSSAVGVLQYQMLATFAEFELNNIRQRTKDGLAQAKRNGKKLGRPKVNRSTKTRVVRLYTNSKLTVDQIAEKCEISRSTTYNILSKSRTKRRSTNICQ